MIKSRWRLPFLGIILFSFLATLGSGDSSGGCGENSSETCSKDFADSSTQEICDDQAVLAGCDIPASWSAATQFCSGVNCTSCP